MAHWFQRFVNSGKVNNATIQGYLRSASQIEGIWQQIDDQVDALIAQGMPPWDAYAKMGYALAFVRACRTYVVFVQELLQADAAADPAGAGYLPKVTYDQALALCENIEPYLEEAIKASTNLRYVPPVRAFPLKLGPRVRYANEKQRFPLPYLQGTIAATQQMRDWAAGLLAKYELALGAAKLPIPQRVSTHVEQMKGELQLGDFHLRTGVDMVGQISQGQVTDELNVKAEGFLWEAMESYFKVSQLVANPGAFAQPQQRDPGMANRVQLYQDSRPATPAENRTMPPSWGDPSMVNRVQPYADKHPTPDVSDLLNQVGASPGPTQVGSIHPTPDVSDLLNQVGANPGTTQGGPIHPTPDISDLLNQVGANPGTTQAGPVSRTPDVSDLLNQVGASPGTTQGGPIPTAPKLSHKLDPKPTASEDSVLDLLSDVCGEQKDTQLG